MAYTRAPYTGPEVSVVATLEKTWDQPKNDGGTFKKASFIVPGVTDPLEFGVFGKTKDDLQNMAPGTTVTLRLSLKGGRFTGLDVLRMREGGTLAVIPPKEDANGRPVYKKPEPGVALASDGLDYAPPFDDDIPF